MDFSAVLGFLKWANQQGLISASEVVSLAIIGWIVITNNRTHEKNFAAGKATWDTSLKEIKTANQDQKDLLKQQVQQQETHIGKCEERYNLLRQDVGVLQEHVAGAQSAMMQEVLNELKTRRASNGNHVQPERDKNL